ncbi:hypothetical protein HCX48_00335 [Rhodocyclus tenuis]|uniref:TMhelix containing protein n=1 Tax=Rhodocyclus gracilis TaxID=2929842 RepID=A0ABX0WFL9_9RHOO|nr:hypothetical protein [Rhodocyclus gracilis]MRD73323.1 hypothetical protein [Rhodocyclus gracilis]NJA87676.1 hypothetical protein [Rhodocyclus gracilis]
MLDSIALLVGYSVMATGAVISLISLAYVVGDKAFRLVFRALDMIDVCEALMEWGKAHPEKLARHKARNGKA